MKIIGNEIHINRGDRGTIRIKSKDNDFKVGDKLKFSIVDKRNYNEVFFQKEYKIDEAGEYATIPLMEEDTRFAVIDRKCLECRYEIEYNNSTTLIGANDNDDNIIKIYAEAGEKQ